MMGRKGWLYIFCFILLVSSVSAGLEEGLVSHYKLNDNWADELQTYTLIPSSNAEFVVGGIDGKSADFEIINGGVSWATTNGIVQHDIGVGDFTWSAWVLPFRSGVTYEPIMSNGLYSPGLYTSLTNGEWGLYWLGALPAGGKITPGDWTHIVVVRRDGQISYYKDGVREPNQYTNSRSVSNNKFSIGSNGGLIGAGGRFGSIFLDEVRVYNRGISDSEIAQIRDEDLNYFVKSNVLSVCDDPDSSVSCNTPITGTISSSDSCDVTMDIAWVNNDFIFPDSCYSVDTYDYATCAAQRFDVFRRVKDSDADFEKVGESSSVNYGFAKGSSPLFTASLEHRMEPLTEYEYYFQDIILFDYNGNTVEHMFTSSPIQEFTTPASCKPKVESQIFFGKYVNGSIAPMAPGTYLEPSGEFVLTFASSYPQGTRMTVSFKGLSLTGGSSDSFNFPVLEAPDGSFTFIQGEAGLINIPFTISRELFIQKLKQEGIRDSGLKVINLQAAVTVGSRVSKSSTYLLLDYSAYGYGSCGTVKFPDGSYGVVVDEGEVCDYGSGKNNNVVQSLNKLTYVRPSRGATNASTYTCFECTRSNAVIEIGVCGNKITDSVTEECDAGPFGNATCTGKELDVSKSCQNRTAPFAFQIDCDVTTHEGVSRGIIDCQSLEFGDRVFSIIPSMNTDRIATVNINVLRYVPGILAEPEVIFTDVASTKAAIADSAFSKFSVASATELFQVTQSGQYVVTATQDYTACQPINADPYKWTVPFGSSFQSPPVGAHFFPSAACCSVLDTDFTPITIITKTID
ncbi:MAG: hypothetical protein ACI8Y7_000503 [Candidatus Woesearchaeota archaeon]|jgi:hypothetical protein